MNTRGQVVRCQLLEGDLQAVTTGTNSARGLLSATWAQGPAGFRGAVDGEGDGNSTCRMQLHAATCARQLGADGSTSDARIDRRSALT